MAALALVVAFLVIFDLPLAATAGALGGQTVAELSKVVMPVPAGLVSDRTSLSGGPTGKIGFSEATSSDCAVSSALQADWLGSQLRYYVSSMQSPQKYLLLCVTLMKTATAAKEDVQKYANNPYLSSKMPSFAAILGART